MSRLPLLRWLRLGRLPWLCLLLFLGAGAASCSINPDKRLLQYLNTEGFGNRYVGDALQENYITIRDSFLWVDTLDSSGERRGNATVEIDGTVFLPEVGTVHVAGMTRTQLEAFLTQKFSAYYKETDVQVEKLASTSAKLYYVFGEVKPQGRRPLTGDITLFDAVWDANPDPVRANLGRIRLIRADPIDPLIIEANLRDMLRYGDSTYNVRIKERDIIVVPPTFLAQLGNFLSALISPVTAVFSSVFQGLLKLNQFNNFQNQNNNAFNLF